MTITITYAPCFHKEIVPSRPNPRKKWPDPRTCPGCKRKRSVCEIHVSPEAKEQLDVPAV